MTSLNQRLISLESNAGTTTGTTTGSITIADVENLQTTLDTKQNTLTAGTNISIVDNVISSSGGTSTVETVSSKMLYGVRVNNGAIPTNATEYTSEYNSFPISNTNLYSFTNDTFTVLQSGNYRIDFNSHFFNLSYTDRAAIRSTVFINNSSLGVNGGGSRTYIRHKDFGRTSSTSAFCILNLSVNDAIQIRHAITKASEPNFSSNFNGFLFNGGSHFAITYLD